MAYMEIGPVGGNRSNFWGSCDGIGSHLRRFAPVGSVSARGLVNEDPVQNLAFKLTLLVLVQGSSTGHWTGPWQDGPEGGVLNGPTAYLRPARAFHAECNAG